MLFDYDLSMGCPVAMARQGVPMERLPLAVRCRVAWSKASQSLSSIRTLISLSKGNVMGSPVGEGRGEKDEPELHHLSKLGTEASKVEMSRLCTEYTA